MASTTDFAKYREPTILVTGGSGLVGTELITQLLKEGNIVKVIYNKTALPVFNGRTDCIIEQCDILNTSVLEECLKGIKYVYHCAALVSFDPADEQLLYKTNIEGTASVVNACINAGIEKLVYVSSVAAMGRIRTDEVITEQMQWSEKTSNSAYGKSKYLAEMEVWRGVGEGLKAVIVNPTIILGGNSWESGSSKIFKTAYDEFPWYAEGVSGFVSVKDVASAMIMLMNSNINAERFILSSQNLTYKEVFSKIAVSFNKKPPYKKVTPLLSEIVWRIEALKGRISKKKPLLTKETAHTAMSRVYFDNSKLLKAFPDFQYELIESIISRTSDLLKAKYNL